MYNKAVREKLPGIIDKILEYTHKFSDYYKIVSHEVNIDDSDLTDLGSYISTYSTCAFNVEVIYTLNDGDERQFSFEVPRMVNGVFIISGKYRLINKYLNDDTQCIRIGDKFRFSTNLGYNLITKIFNHYDWDNDDRYAVDFEGLKEQLPDFVKLNERQSWKLKVLLDLDYLPTEITEDILDKLSMDIVDNNDVLNKKVVGIENILFDTLNKIALDIAKEGQHNFKKYGTVSPVGIQQAINKIFYNQGSELHAINNSDNVNPYSFDSINQKIQLPVNNVDNIYAQKYDESLAEIIDPIMTPDNGNINIINYLNSGTKVEGETVKIKVLNKDFTPTHIEYYKYAGSKVVPYRFVDYEEETIAEDYLILENRIEKPGKDYDYIQCSPDERLSVSTQSIPMLNLTDTVRLAMAAKMIGQAVPLLNAEKPRVMSGHESDQSQSTTNINYESNTEGTVVDITDTTVTVLTKDSIDKVYQIPSPVIGTYDITSVYEPCVKVGDTVQPGKPIISHRIAAGGTKNFGINALTAFMPFRGYNYEDGVVISESFANKLTHLSIVDVVMTIKDTESIVSILPIGSKVKSRDVMMSVVSSFRNQSSEKLIRLIHKDEDLSKMNNMIVPNNITEAYITDISYSYDVHKTTLNRKERFVLNESSVDVLKKTGRNNLPFPKFIPKSFLSKINDIEDYDGFAAYVKIRLVTVGPGKVGTKIANRYGSKGLVSLVLPDDEMVTTMDGRNVEVIFLPDAVPARKNFTQVPEMFLSKIANTVSINGLKQTTDEFRSSLKKYGLTNYSKLKDEELESIKGTNLSYITGCYSKFSMKQLYAWMDELGITIKEQVIDGIEKRPIRNPVDVSDMYLMKLYQLPEKINKVYTESSVSDPLLGMGTLRQGGGQKQGEMEYHAFAASDLDEYVYSTRKKYAFKEAAAININLAIAGISLDSPENRDLLNLDKLIEKYKK